VLPDYRSRLQRGESGKEIASRNVSVRDDDRFEVLALDDHRAVVGAVESRDEVEQVSLEPVPAGLADSLERLERRTVIAAPVLDICRRRRIAPDDVALLDADVIDASAEQLAETFLGAPLDRRAEARRRWDVAGDDLEQAADEPVRRVRDEPDAPAGRLRSSRVRVNSGYEAA
jgi:hypothetical protein